MELPEQANPARLRAALGFGALYVVVGVAVAAAKQHLGDDAVYGVAVVSGLTDIDALTLSVAQLHDGGSVEAATAWRAIFLATDPPKGCDAEGRVCMTRGHRPALLRARSADASLCSRSVAGRSTGRVGSRGSACGTSSRCGV